MLNADLVMTIQVPNDQVKIHSSEHQIELKVFVVLLKQLNFFSIFQFAHVYPDILEIHWAIVCVVNVKVILNVQTVVPVLITHALIHALDSVVLMQSVKLNDILPFANAQEVMMVMLHHHACDNHGHIMDHFHDTIRKSEQQQPNNWNDLPTHKNTHTTTQIHRTKLTPLINDF